MDPEDIENLAVLDQAVGLDPQYCVDRPMVLSLEKQWSFSGQDHIIRDQDGKILMKSDGSAFEIDRDWISFTDNLDREIFRCLRIYPKSQFDVFVPHSLQKVFEIDLMFGMNHGGKGSAGSRTRFKDHLTGVDKEIVINWDTIARRRGMIYLRDDVGHEGRNEKMYGKGVPIGYLGDFDRGDDQRLELTPKIDYALVAITAICSKYLN
ncbi:hypothetical protein I302_107179 [Kwoniella bestiolae CBS 10118]|uniref:Uncharacterized protein n=1 Tax=Kwoniella bestiolae CBS 10118 TaxID=1296100 RepID=A0A1B9FZ96_9TREE|nr:hypothetical protein I302_05556 [Kwoniella bestiolae CBS 10118]OCF24098.1 hypothetical protein I302_05556 [Kwoniella bestiolae CBS 10118]